jgi:hypothetical protein
MLADFKIVKISGLKQKISGLAISGRKKCPRKS